jgi:PAS domain S-box-containing protein
MKINNKINKNEKLNKPLLKEIPTDKTIKNSNRANSSYKSMLLKLKGLSSLQKKTEDLFEKSEQHYKSFFENSLDGMYKSTLAGNYIDANPTLVKILGYSSKKELLSVNIPNQVYVSKKYRPSPKDRNKLFETQLKKKDGTIIWVEISSRVIYNEGKPAHYEGIVRNITGRKKSEERSVYLSFHDNLTGLYNRAYFEEEIKRLDTKRQLPLSFIIGDINSLKLVNDAFGHIEGDRLIVKVAEVLKAFCRQEDAVARWGGDEFTILLP